MTRVVRFFLFLFFFAQAAHGATPPRILKVGPGEPYAKPSDAARDVKSGDIVEIAPGHYTDCAVWPESARNVTIEGKDAQVTIGGKTCEDRALFLLRGENTIVRGIEFTGAKDTRHNGAGILTFARNLTVEKSRFIGNENGILAAFVPGSTVTIRGSYFRGNGACISECAHAIYVNRIALLRIEGSEFFEQYVGHHVKSRALRTELSGNTIHDGPRGTASYLVEIPDGGTLIARGNVFEKGPNAQNHSAAIAVGGESTVNPTAEILIEGNSFRNGMTVPTVFLLNRSTTPAILRGNRIEGKTEALSGPGRIETNSPAQTQR